MRARGEPRQHDRRAVVVEAEPVDDRVVGVETEQARARIAGLRARRHGADLDEAEAEPQQRVRHLGILVEAGREADRIGEIQPEGADRKPRIVGPRRRQRRQLQRAQREPVRVLRVETTAGTGARGARKGRSRRENSSFDAREPRRAAAPSHKKLRHEGLDSAAKRL